MPLAHLGFVLAGVQQDSEGWDPRNMIREPSKAFQCYLLFLLVVCVVCVVKLIKVWKVAFPFALSRHLDHPQYLEFLQVSSNSLKQWIVLTFLAWALFMSTNVYQFCGRLLGQRFIGGANVVFVVWDYATLLTLTLAVVSFLSWAHSETN